MICIVIHVQNNCKADVVFKLTIVNDVRAVEGVSSSLARVVAN